jgi:CheY-like chemotaxis protein
VYDGKEAVEKAKEWKPNLLLSDVCMPGMSGTEAAIQICKLIPECRVLLFSGYAGFADLLSDTKAQGYHFEVLQKPLHPADLIARLQAIVTPTGTAVQSPLHLAPWRTQEKGPRHT